MPRKSNAKPDAPAEEPSVLVIPSEDGSYLNGVPHVPQHVTPDLAEAYVASGAFHLASAGDAESFAAPDGAAAPDADTAAPDTDAATPDAPQPPDDLDPA